MAASPVFSVCVPARLGACHEPEKDTNGSRKSPAGTATQRSPPHVKCPSGRHISSISFRRDVLCYASSLSHQRSAGLPAVTCPVTTREPSDGRRAALAGLGALVVGLTIARKASAEVGVETLGDRTVVTTASGVRYTDLSVGEGPELSTGGLIVAQVVGTLDGDGKEFLNTFRTGSPITFSLGIRPGNITEGLEEGLRGMRAGGRRLIVVPPALGYGRMGARSAQGVSIPGNAKLYYDVELLRCNGVSEGSPALVCCQERVFPCQLPQDPAEVSQ